MYLYSNYCAIGFHVGEGLSWDASTLISILHAPGWLMCVSNNTGAPSSSFTFSQENSQLVIQTACLPACLGSIVYAPCRYEAKTPELNCHSTHVGEIAMRRQVSIYGVLLPGRARKSVACACLERLRATSQAITPLKHPLTTRRLGRGFVTCQRLLAPSNALFRRPLASADWRKKGARWSEARWSEAVLVYELGRVVTGTVYGNWRYLT